GDTWSGNSIGINWNWGGTSGNPIYIGVDQGWYSGSAWARPIFSCGGAACTGASSDFFVMNESKAYNIFDNIELKGLYETPTVHPNYFDMYGTNNTVENVYVHGWTYTGTSGAGQASQIFAGTNSPGTGNIIRYDVGDGSDTNQISMFFTHSGIATAYGNVMNYMPTGLDGCGNNWHDNLFENMTVASGHQDAFLHTSSCSGTTYLVYNNLLRNSTFASSGGAGHYWLNGLGNCGAIGTPLTNCMGYFFNNLAYNNQPGNMIDAGSHFGVNLGTLYIFNNTIQCGTDTTPGDCGIGDNGNAQGGVASGGTMALNLINNHWIAADTTSVLCCSGPAGTGSHGSCYSFTCSETTPVYQTLAQAQAQGYTDASTYVFEPTESNGSTIGTGASLNSLCSAVGAIDADAGAACQEGTTYACLYNSTNHTVSCPSMAAVTRTAGAWNVGAYQFSTSTAQSSAPKAPQGLMASVQ
ncbi:MAG: hypothetical protein WBQ59_16495, partial [Candidatus Acidiferrum sp.]